MFQRTVTRLNKYISESGICSRREADKFIEQGKVFINGRRAQVGDQVAPGDRVMVNGQVIEPQEAEHFVFIALNKPVGVVCTTETSEPDNIIDFIHHSARIFPIGRLDKDSQGLIFLTNQGDLVNKILRAGNNHEKEYVVTVNKPITDEFITGMANGVPILGETTKKCKVSKETNTSFRITLVQGLNRQIRRMCEYFAYEAVKLERVRIMNISLKGLELGDWRDLKEAELKILLSSVADSSSGAKKSSAPKQGGQNKSARSGAVDNRASAVKRSATGNRAGGAGKSGGARSAGASKAGARGAAKAAAKPKLSRRSSKNKRNQTGRKPT